MDLNKTLKQHAIITSQIENCKIKDALDNIKEMASALQNWHIGEKAEELETNYKYMIHYLVEGNEDPEQQNVYNHLIRSLFALADELSETAQLHSSSKLYFEKLRLTSVHGHRSISDFRDDIAKHADNLSVISLMPDGEDKSIRLKQKRTEFENSVRDMFYAVFVSPAAGNGMIQEYKAFMDDEVMSKNVKNMFVSALTMNILQRFDHKKINFLLDIANFKEPETALRAIIGIVPIFRKYRNRMHSFPLLTSKLAVMSDDPLFVKRLMNILIQYIQAHETEKITKKLTEEIIPEMMKLSPMIGKKINLEEWMGETNFDEKNPEWQKILDEAGLSDKMQEFSEMQLGGADVFHSTFSNLKTYPFFHEMSNWFLPFDINHSTLLDMFSDKSEGESLLTSMLGTSMICNSDKYSFAYSIMAMPEQYRKMMISQLGAETDELKKMAEEELVLNPNQQEEGIIKQYIQDLYRFFKLFQRKADFSDIFGATLDYHRIDAFNPVVQQPENLEKIALYYFEKNNFDEALQTYQMLTKMNVATEEIWQKIGYCRQMAGDIEGALSAYQKAELIDQNNSWLLRRIAGCYRLLKQPESALQYYRRLDQIHPENLNIQLNIGHCFLELDQYDEALNYYFKVDLMSSGNTRAWRSIAWCSFLSGKYDTAQKYYAQIIANKPNAHDFINAGHVELCTNNMKKAVEFYVQSVKYADGIKQFNQMFNDDYSHLIKAGIDKTFIPLIMDKVKYDL